MNNVHTIGTPHAACCRPVNSEQHQRGLPFVVLLVKVPHVCITVLGAGEQTVGLGCPVDGSHKMIVLRKKLYKVIKKTSVLSIQSRGNDESLNEMLPLRARARESTCRDLRFRWSCTPKYFWNWGRQRSLMSMMMMMCAASPINQSIPIHQSSTSQ